jgi:hypothetical protein
VLNRNLQSRRNIDPSQREALLLYIFTIFIGLSCQSANKEQKAVA